MNWEVEYEGQRHRVGDLGITNIKRKQVNQGIDTVRFVDASRSAMEDPLFKAQSTVVIYRDDQKWFEGIITKVPGFGKGPKNWQEYELSGPWWYLKNLVYQQSWEEAENEHVVRKVDTGRVVLGQDSRGMRMNSRNQIEAILQYSIDHGAPIAIGTIDPQVEFPYDEIKDISCAEAISRVLRWCPDCVAWFDYTTNGFPTLHITRRSNAKDLIIDMGDESTKVQGLTITPRYDLQLPSVVVKYEKLNHTEGKSWRSTHVDAYPATSTGKELKALVITVELDGVRTHKVKQPIKTAKIEAGDALWWKQHVPGLGRIPLEALSIKNVERETDLPYELLSGVMAPWMGRRTQTETVRCLVSYETKTEAVYDREVAVRLIATDARSKVFETEQVSGSAESTPVGLAKALYEGVSQLQYDGQISLGVEEVGMGSGWVAKNLSILGGRKEWEKMGAVVQWVEEDLAGGVVRVKFGPANHLGPDDMVELLRVNRTRQASVSAIRRMGGTMGGLVQGEHARVENTDQVGGKVGKMTFMGGEEEVQVQLKQEYVAVGGELKTRWVLASEEEGVGNE